MAKLNEEKIRDYLIQNLDLVEPGLNFLGKEYHLRNPNGSNGFLDIFALGQSGEHVIIEIKRTRNASREAIQELIKYGALLRHKFLLKERDYRFILLSADWTDLRVPYSEWVHDCSYDVSAGKIVVDELGSVHVEEVDVLPRAKNRRFARRHYLWQFGSRSAVNRATTIVAKHMTESGVNDFILVRSTQARDGINYLYFAQQQNSTQFYIDHLKARISDDAFRGSLATINSHVLEIDREAVAADEAYRYDFDVVHAQLGSIASTISTPERAAEWFTPERISDAEIKRYGRFRDSLLTKPDLINEVSGTDSFHQLDIVAKTASKAQMGELAAAAKRALQFNNEWHATLRELFEYASAGGPAVIRLHIYSSDDILRVLAAELYEANLYTPALRCEIDFGTHRESFVGFLEWDGAEVDVRLVADRHFGEAMKRYGSEKHFGSHRARNMDVMSDLGLRYSIAKTAERTFHRVRLQGNKMVAQTAKEGLPDFIAACRREIEELATFFGETDTGFDRAIQSYHSQKIVNAEEFLNNFIKLTQAQTTGKFWLGEVASHCDHCGRAFANLKYFADATFRTEGYGSWCAACLVDKTRENRGYLGDIYVTSEHGWQKVEIKKPL